MPYTKKALNELPEEEVVRIANDEFELGATIDDKKADTIDAIYEEQKKRQSASQPQAPAEEMIEVEVIRGIGIDNETMAYPGDEGVFLPKSVAKKLQDAGAVKVKL